MSLIIRLRCRSGMKRLVFSIPNPTFMQLQREIEKQTNIPMDMQLLSTTQLTDPNFLHSIEPNRSLESLGLKNGDILYIFEDENDQQKKPIDKSLNKSRNQQQSQQQQCQQNQQKSIIRLTPNCKHGSQAACPYCAGVKPGEDITKIRGVCNHPSSATCIHCSKYVAENSSEPAPWLCNHPETVFCPLCLPPEEDGITAANRRIKCDCDHSKGQHCINCVSKAPTIKVDKIPFRKWLDEKRALCKFKHGPNVNCAFCAPPAFPSFKSKSNCNRHPPGGVCLSCAPPNCIMRIQEYRHCDSISIDSQMLIPWYQNWIRLTATNKYQRACILFGKYVDEPIETGNPGAIRALVYALYEPPQDNSTETIRFLPDPQESNIHSIANELGLHPVGWVIGCRPRSGEKYGGKVLLSGSEVQLAARFQARYKDSIVELSNNPADSTQLAGYSKFVTVVVEHSDQVEPVAYQIADAAVALESEGYLEKSNDPCMLQTRRPKQGEMIPTIVYKDRPLQPETEFLPDEMLVKVNLTQPKKNSQELLFFSSHTFPFNPSNQTEATIKQHLKQKQNQEYETKLSDFNLLIALIKIVGLQIILKICQAIRNRSKIDNATREAIDRTFIQKDLI